MDDFHHCHGDDNPTLSNSCRLSMLAKLGEVTRWLSSSVGSNSQHMEVSWNGATPKSSIFLLGSSIINIYKPSSYWGTSICGNPSTAMGSCHSHILLGFDDGHLFLRSWQKCPTYKEGSNELKTKLLAIHWDSLYLSIPIKSSFDTFFV
jgi:hypothetical protein